MKSNLSKNSGIGSNGMNRAGGIVSFKAFKKNDSRSI
jgi:hypothetical protein